MNGLPTGTVTFLFTDIEGSTRLWEAVPDAMRVALARHDSMLRDVIERAGGVVFKTVGDAFCAVFRAAPEAVGAAVGVQRALRGESWPDGVVLRVRMALHTGLAQERDRDYFGPVLNRVARLLAAGHGGQMLMSAATCELVRDALPEAVRVRELGAYRLKDMERPEHVYQVEADDLPGLFPPLRSREATPNNLPQQPTSFIGRETEREQARGLLGKTRLLSVIGAGGGGKSRLALQIAAEALESYADGAWFIELAPLPEAALVPQAVASVLGVKEQAGQSLTETLVQHVREKHLLLVLDNCEHLLSGCATLSSAFLRGCPRVRLIATSREPLGIAGEATYRLPPLSLPTPRQAERATPASLGGFEAARLFVERAQAVRQEFAITDANAPALAQLCYRLDGIPLAIELAAARVRSLAVEQINDKLDARFRLLTGGDKSALPRQQTLRALVDWSYDLLTENEKTLLGRLSVFAGGWSLEAAESICGFAPLDEWDLLDLLTSLVDKSLVVAEEDATSHTTRYRMLETLRQYAAEKSGEGGEGDALRTRHRDCYLALARTAEPELTGPDQALWLDRLETEHDNIRAALAGAPGETGLQLAGALWRFWDIRGYLSEGREQITRALDAARDDSPLRAKALNGAGALAYRQGDYTRARALLEQGLPLCQAHNNHLEHAHALTHLADVTWYQQGYNAARPLYEAALGLYRDQNAAQGIAETLGNLGWVARYDGDYAQARTLQEESLARYRASGNTQGIATTLNSLGSLALDQHDYAGAQALFDEALARYRDLRNTQGIALMLGNLGLVARERGDYPQAETLFTEALALHRDLGYKLGSADTLFNLGSLIWSRGDDATARAQFAESLALHRELGNKHGTAIALDGLGRIALEQGDLARALPLHEEALTLLREMDDPHALANTLVNLGRIAQEQGRFPAARSAYEDALHAFHALNDSRAVANTQTNLGQLAIIQGDFAAAHTHYHSALTLYQSADDALGLAYTLEGFAAVALGQSRPAAAVTLWAAAAALRTRHTLPLPPRNQSEQHLLQTQAHTVLGPLPYAAAQNHGLTLPLPDAIALALGA